MLLPKWLSNVSWPVWVGDVCTAIASALDHESDVSLCFDLPGTERISHEALLRRVALHVGKRPPLLHVPLLSPRLSSYWIALVTRADLALAQELVEGLQSDLEPSCPLFWDQVESLQPTPLDTAIGWALRDAGQPSQPTEAMRKHLHERMRTAT